MTEPTTTAAPIGTEIPDTPADPTQDIKVAYAIGIRKDDSIFFDIGGEMRGLVELMGLHALAEQKIREVHDVNQKTGTALLNAKLDAIVKALQTMAGITPGEELPTNTLKSDE